MDDQGLDSSEGQDIFLSYKTSRPNFGPTHIALSEFSEAPSPAVKRPEHEANHSLSSSS